tara:strand:+ start:221 stop:544 length:324 start_codon:yes stop_codon:yes gene_type:complete
MGILDTLLDSSKKKQTIQAQAKKIGELEKIVKDLSDNIEDLRAHFSELTSVVTIISTNQQKLAADMEIIYESVQAVGDALTGQAAVDDEKYFSWRWNTGDDDDDLLN